MWKISNLISLFRLLASFPLAYFLWNNMLVEFFVLGVIAFFTDYLDGFFARKLNQISELGKIIDPLADKVLLGGVTLVLILQNKLPLWLAVAIIGRDLILLLGGIIIKKKYDVVPPSNFFGKITVNVYSVEFILMILNVEIAFTWGVWITFAFAVISFILYILDLSKLIKNKNSLAQA